MSICEVQNCCRPVVGRGMCSKHYQRWKATGATMDGPKARASAQDRFWRYVQKGTDEDDCWLWTGMQRKDGYGCLTVRNNDVWKKVGAHRFAYEMAHGPIPTGLVTRHRCDNPLCVNPGHMKLGLPKDNTADMIKRGRERHVRGEDHGKAVFSETEVRYIRSSRLGPRELSRMFGVSYGAIQGIRQNVNWKHIK
jgi:hypothetical protein